VKELYVFCEGYTEQAFCNRVLQPHLFPAHDGRVHTLPVGWKNHRGVKGVRNYPVLRKFIVNTLKSRKHDLVHFTTMIDLYALPGDYPGKAGHVRNPADPIPYVLALEKALGDDIDDRRFLPYFQLHEFETLLFASPGAFAIAFENCLAQVAALEAIANSVASIEYINDGPLTAPSKRVIAVFAEYKGRKATAGPDIAAHIGLPVLREKCPHFGNWLGKLESLAWEADAL
jgi:hypothetical protein